MNENKLPELKKNAYFTSKNFKKTLKNMLFKMRMVCSFQTQPAQTRHLLLSALVLPGDSGRSDGFRTGRLVGGSRLGGAQDFVVF